MKQLPAAEQPNQSLAKALDVFDTFSTEHSEWGIRELARDLKLHPATLYRIVRTLCNKGYLEQNPVTQGYAIGPKVLKLANLYNYCNPLPKVAHTVFESYVDRFEHNMFLAMLSGHEVIYLATLYGRGPIKIIAEPGYSLPLHTNALGKVLLAFETPQFIQEFLEKNPLKKYTSRTISKPEELLKQLHEIRSNGYAINDGEQFDLVGAIAVHLFGPEKQPINLAVSLTYPRHLVIDGTLEIDKLIALGEEIAVEIRDRCNISNWMPLEV